MSVKRTILKAVPIPALPGYESRMVLLEYPPGCKGVLHTHPVTGINYVVEGDIISQWADGEPEHYTAGDTFLDHAEQLHVRTDNASGEKPLRIVVNYVIPVGEPNVHMV